MRESVYRLLLDNFGKLLFIIIILLWLRFVICSKIDRLYTIAIGTITSPKILHYHLRFPCKCTSLRHVTFLSFLAISLLLLLLGKLIQSWLRLNNIWTILQRLYSSITCCHKTLSLTNNIAVYFRDSRVKASKSLTSFCRGDIDNTLSIDGWWIISWKLEICVYYRFIKDFRIEWWWWCFLIDWYL